MRARLAWSATLLALSAATAAPPRRTRCDDDGDFCVRYLTPGTYSLFIHDPDASFRRVDDVEAPAGVVDLGELTLTPARRSRSRSPSRGPRVPVTGAFPITLTAGRLAP
ncbi:hypothetical protein [Planctomyces sp. SH-PL62]|uniref:hypothetical protein n=1 Tax=Planctomyces sp. SH-PL62 TaxID=1636152 RepID=UPI00078DD54F|nr:hypothetical protein [Planctomyces sp. SH-PL62]AMV35820.1 hypothetical protein VT85_00150 [Planctomyces sp. SH-PL62]